MLKMPVRTKEIKLDGEYKGFTFEANLAIPMKIFSYIQTGQWGLIQMALRQILISWNFNDEEGNPLPQPNEIIPVLDPIGNPVLVPSLDENGQPKLDEEKKPVMIPFVAPGVSFIPTDLGMSIIGKIVKEIGDISTP